MRLRIKFENDSFRDYEVPDEAGLPVAARCDWAEDPSDGTTDQWFVVAPAEVRRESRRNATLKLTSSAGEVIVQGY